MRQDFIATQQQQPVTDAPLALAVIIPTFNEAANIVPLLQKLAAALAGIHWEVVFIDDDSPDGTSDLVRSIAQTNRQVRIVQRIGRRGLSTAVIEGMLATAAPVLAVMDGDMQHDETILPLLFQAVANGDADIAVGTRYSAGGSVGAWDSTRHKMSRLATSLAQRLLKAELSDPMSGFFAIRRETLMAAMPRLSGVGYKILLDIVASLPTRAKIAEFPYMFRMREAGESKLGTLVMAEYASLLAEKTIGRFIPIRLIKFLMVGGLGVGVHLAILGAALAANARFMVAQTCAVMTAIACNFFLNNIFTYRDRMLKGWQILGGLLSFYLVSAIGAVANIGIGTWVSDHDDRWWLAGMAGVVVGAVWNFAASSFVTWRKR